MQDEVVSLTVPIPQQPETLIVVSADLLNKINELSVQAASLSVVTNDIENEALSAMLKVVTGLEKQVEEDASAANKPYYEIQKLITAAKQTASKPLANLKATIKNSLVQYVLKRDRERAEADAEALRQRQAEAAALAEVNAKRAAEAVAQNAPAPAPLVAPVSEVLISRPAQAKADATKIARKMVCRIIDAHAVPRAYCVPDLALIEAANKRGEITPEIHTFYVCEEVVSVSAK